LKILLEFANPFPIIGSAIGASIGASVGVYKNLTKPEQSLNVLPPCLENQTDFYQEMLNLDELKQRGIISEDEFAMLKKRFLDNYQS
jgi:Short C-terminal domain